MEIIVKNHNLVEFGRVPSGKVFRIDYEGSLPIYAMKIDRMYGEGCDPANSIDLSDGSWFWVDDYNEVTICDSAKLVIE